LGNQILKKMKTKLLLLPIGLVIGFLFLVTVTITTPGCAPDKPGDTTTAVTPPKAPRIPGPEFNADSAYAFTKAQVDFGPRVPGSPEHEKCAAWLKMKMESFGMTVTVQNSPATLYTGKTFTMSNIFSQYKPERTDRILLVAHWDSRHIADRDPDTTYRNKPIDGASDGASGVAVLLEIARIITEKDPNIGVDFLMVDAEDTGMPGGDENTWCLGSQYWSQTVKPEYAKTVHFGILLDMVGGRGAIFPREGTSVRFAANAVEKVWSAAQNLGYGAYFVNSVTGETVDDNRFIIQNAGIPCIDIVHYDPAEQDYGPYHHRHTDNMDIIDVASLDAVGNVLVDVIYNEMPKK